MVKARKGLAIVPAMFHPDDEEEICFIPLKGDQYLLRVIAAWKKQNNNPAIRKFIQKLSFFK